MREVVVGCHSKVWLAASRNALVAERFALAIGHRDVFDFRFTTDDRVWVFAYSRIPEENERLLARLQAAAVREVVYVSSASTVVLRYTRCYEYPRVKQQAEAEARRRLDARILTLGLVFESISELPPGRNAATSLNRIVEFLLAPYWSHDGGVRMHLFETVDRPFPGRWHAHLQRTYGALQWMLRRCPCVLRPLDYMLRAIGIRWYGYVHLSNRLWTSTTS